MFNNLFKAKRESSMDCIDCIMRMTKDGSEFDRLIAAKRCNIPCETLDILAQDKSPLVREAVASNENTQTKTLCSMKMDRDEQVRKAVAGNENTPIEVVMGMMFESSREVRDAACLNFVEKLRKIESKIKRYNGNYRCLPEIDIVIHDTAGDSKETISNKKEQQPESKHYLREDDLAYPFDKAIKSTKDSMASHRRVTDYMMESMERSFDSTKEAKEASRKIKEYLSDSNTGNDEDLRMWCFEHPSQCQQIFDQYNWLAEVEGHEREIRKYCITHYSGMFKTDQEFYRWIKTGDIPEWLTEKLKEISESLDKKDSKQ